MFRNLQIYRLPSPWQISLEQLEEQLGRGRFRRCPESEPMSRGWNSPRGDGALVYALNRQWLITLAVEKRLLPAAVINQTADALALEKAQVQGYTCGRKQMRELREQVAQELLPKAFTRTTRMHAWIDREAGWLVIDASSPTKAADLIEHLRKCLDDFPLSLVKTKVFPSSAMADWLAAGEACAGFSIDRDSELRGRAEDKSVVRYVRCPLEGEDIKDRLAAGMIPTRLAMTWNDRISFILTDKLEIKRLAFLDLLKEEAQKNAELAGEQFDADFALMTGELGRFLPQLIDALGGEVRE